MRREKKKSKKSQDLCSNRCRVLPPVFGNSTSSLGISIRGKHTSASISLIYNAQCQSVQSGRGTTKREGHTFSTVVDMMAVVPNYATKVSSIVPSSGLFLDTWLVISQCLRRPCSFLLSDDATQQASQNLIWLCQTCLCVVVVA